MSFNIASLIEDLDEDSAESERLQGTDYIPSSSKANSADGKGNRSNISKR